MSEEGSHISKPRSPDLPDFDDRWEGIRSCHIRISRDRHFLKLARVAPFWFGVWHRICASRSS